MEVVPAQQASSDFLSAPAPRVALFTSSKSISAFGGCHSFLLKIHSPDPSPFFWMESLHPRIPRRVSEHFVLSPDTLCYKHAFQ